MQFYYGELFMQHKKGKKKSSKLDDFKSFNVNLLSTKLHAKVDTYFSGVVIWRSV